ncbi:nuclear transport factor 2 family protein [Nocardioides sp. CPCC 205120]|uniref:nuclear transport factor 2 family protein n=1 Tax=Nocardioides sp. CPCC 205120 TaxID=3406462 RepID=UPI003B504610
MDTTHDPYRPELLPEAVHAYLSGYDGETRDVERAAATFGPSAVVVDDGSTYTGLDEIRTWLARSSSEYRFTTTYVGQERLGDDEWRVLAHLEGDFPGGTVDLGYRFTLQDGRIAALTIAP